MYGSSTPRETSSGPDSASKVNEITSQPAKRCPAGNRMRAASTDPAVPIIVTIIGEGGSGGALAIAVGDSVQMLQYSTYSVISPEGCASILWKSSARAADAAETMGITAARIKSLGLVDRVVNEPTGGAHRDHVSMAQSLKKALQESLKQIAGLTPDELIERRFERLMSYGKFKEQPVH